MPGRLTLGLYNSYDPRRFHEAHRRALARAAPLALAWDANLAAIGFPWKELAGGVKTARGREEGEPDLSTPAGIARTVAASTSIGEGGAYFVDLAEKGRFQTFGFPERGFPPQLGEIVLTTEHAQGPKAVGPRDVAEGLLSGRSHTLVFGLGPHGVPKEVHAAVRKEMDVTGGRNLSLETCTAMGACVAAVGAWVEALRTT